MRIAAFRLQEDLVRGLVSEPHDLVFNTGAIARAGRLNLPAVHRSPMQVRPDQLMDLVVRLSQPARHLRIGDRVGQIRERHRIGIARLLRELTEVDRPPVEPTRRSCLKTLEFEPNRRRSSDSVPVVPSPPAHGSLGSPVCMIACRKVPVVMITAFAR